MFVAQMSRAAQKNRYSAADVSAKVIIYEVKLQLHYFCALIRFTNRSNNG
jgi:hypothetical protein